MEGRTRQVEMPTGLRDGMVFSIVEPFQPLLGAFAQLRRVREAADSDKKRGEEVDAPAAADGFERGTG